MEETTWDPFSGPPPPAEGCLVSVAPADLFDPSVDSAVIERAMQVIAGSSGCFSMVTRRAKRLLMLGNEGLRFPPNLWIGVEVDGADDMWRVEDLLRCNTAHPWVLVHLDGAPLQDLPIAMLAWVVAEGPAPLPSGSAAQARLLRDRCIRDGIPFRLRQGSGPVTAALPLDGEEWWQLPAGVE